MFFVDRLDTMLTVQVRISKKDRSQFGDTDLRINFADANVDIETSLDTKLQLLEALSLISPAYTFYAYHNLTCHIRLIIDIAYLKCLQNSSEGCAKTSPIDVADFNWAPVSIPSFFTLHRGVDDPEVDYFSFFVNGQKHGTRKFDLSPTEVQEMELFTPKNISSFLWRWERSRFIECARTPMERSAWTMRVIPLDFIEQMVTMRDLMVDLSITPILFAGTLL
uniref:Fmp27_GFWDK domain-containing protein n=1 Tax=Steinernema glaseri TaxID=37863 RepID=A0A1I8AJI0_9BILA